jgi:tetratricopeptide (TPR) repeat protein
VYQTLVRSRREAHHERAGQAIEALCGERLDEWVEVLAHHYSRGGNDAKALEYLELANRKASRANAPLEAAAYFDEASALLDRMPDTPDNRRRRVALVTDQFHVYFMLYRVAEYLELARSYEAMAVEVDDRPVLGVFYKNIAHCQWLFGQWEDTLRTAHQAVAICEDVGNFAGLGMACELVEWTHLARADFDEGLAWAVKSLAAFQQDLDVVYCVWTRTGAAWAHALQGHWQQALDECREALELASAYSDEGSASFSLWVRSLTFSYQGDTEAALQNATLAAERAPTPAEQSWAQSHLGWAWCRAGQADRGIEILASLSRLYGESGLTIGEMFNGSYLGEAYWRAGRLAEAGETLRALVDRAGQSGMRFYLGTAHRLLGEVTRAAEPSDDGRHRAAAHFERSIAVLSEIGAENELALAHAGYGRLCRDGGDQSEARRHLTLALEVFERLGTLAEPDQVRKDLAELG